MRRPLRLTILCALVCASCGPSDGAPRHLVLITLDTLRADRLGTYGYERPTSPHLDALAREGARFDDAIAQATLTPPSHASILTGLNPPAHGLRELYAQALPARNRTLAEILADAGFETAAFVSALPLEPARGLDQGFATYEASFLPKLPSRLGRVTNVHVRRWLEQRGQPDRLFLWVHYFDPHIPYFAPASYRARFHPVPVRPRDLMNPLNANEGDQPPVPVPSEVVRRMSDMYDAEVAYTDDAVGELLELLREHGILEHAIVAVVADHGESHGERGYYFGHWDVFRETARVPLILVRPDGRYAGVRVGTTVRTVDLLPTFLAWLGLAEATPAGLDGRDLTPLLDGREHEPRTAFTEQTLGSWRRSVRRGPWLLHESQAPESGLALFLREDGTEHPVADAPEPLLAELSAALRTSLAEAAPTQPTELSEQTAEQLRALGYAVDPSPAEPPTERAPDATGLRPSSQSR